MTTETTHAVRLQELYFRLLFCDETFDLYRTNPRELLTSYDLDETVLASLPGANTPQLQAERRGRRHGVEHEIRSAFGQSYVLVEKRPHYAFANFLCSEAFYDPGAGLPHPFGSGQGYENMSKFFFWPMAAVDLASPTDGPQARWLFNGDFAAHILELPSLGADDYYRQFAQGMIWRDRPGIPLPAIRMNVDRQVFRIADMAALDAIVAAGAVRLETLAPEPVPEDENIR